MACSNCRQTVDWWRVVSLAIEDNFMGNQAFELVGSKTILFELTLQPGERLTYRLADLGLPPNAKVLYINYTPQGAGGLFPNELHGNVPTRRYPRGEVTLYPVPFGDEPTSPTKVATMLSWIESSRDDESFENLVSAFEFFTTDLYSPMVIPANVAVESVLNRFLTGFLQKFVGAARVESFLENGATYSHQLNVLLPVIARLKGWPALPDHIRGLLNALREARNELAHQGILARALSRPQAADLLCAAFFGMHYVRMLNARQGET